MSIRPRIDDYLERAADLRRRGESFVTATVVRVERPTSGRPGDRAIVTADGRVHGWVGGSCAEPSVVAEARAALADGKTRLLRLSPDPSAEPEREGTTTRNMTCFSGGAMEVFVEPHFAPPHLLVFGASPVGLALVALGKAAAHRVTLVELAGRETSESGADLVVTSARDVPARDAAPTFAVVCTHGTFDEAALDLALGQGADYVGLVTSRRRLEALRAEALERGVDRSLLDRLHAPAGLDIGAQGPEEIAVSILAEIVRERRAVGVAPAPVTSDAGRQTAEIDLPVALDPICGMSVVKEGARHSFDYHGETYYFCCAGCRAKFAAAPETYLAARGSAR
jgi:xanthine dehydrogenase accessory factor